MVLTTAATQQSFESDVEGDGATAVAFTHTMQTWH